MSAQFIGRERQLGVLYRLLAEVTGSAEPTPGRAVLVRGRRRVGKSRLVEEFLARAVIPHVYLSAAGVSSVQDLQLLLKPAALAVDGPGVLVIDDLPAAPANDPELEETLRALFESELAGRRVLMIMIGADPFGPWAPELLLSPLAPSEVGAMLGLAAADAFDAYLITGGLPQLVAHWPAGASVGEYLDEALRSPTSPLVVSGERALAAEFPTQAQARQVLAAIGSGERTFTTIRRAAGNPQQGSLSRALTTLRDKGLVVADVPLSTSKSVENRYRVADPDLRFWLSFVGPGLAEIERARGDLVLERLKASWTSWRASAVQPVLREALARVPGSVAELGVVGAYWTRSGKPEIDVIVADRGPIAGRLLGVGSIHWRDDQPFTDQGYGELLLRRAQIPGADERTSLFVVTRSESSVPGLPAYGPEQLLAAW